MKTLLRWAGLGVAAIAAAATVIFGVVSPANADGSYSTNLSWGYAQGSVSSRVDYLYLSGQIRDNNCTDSYRVALEFEVVGSNGSVVETWDVEGSAACGSLRSVGSPFYASDLDGQRSGYVRMKICKIWWINWTCSQFASSFYSIQ